jgi:hypothetical protein
MPSPGTPINLVQRTDGDYKSSRKIFQFCFRAKYGRLPWERNQRPTYQVQVEVLRFEPNAEQLVELWARWSILANARKTISVKDSYLSQRAIDRSAEASVAAMSDVLANFSQEIAAAIRDDSSFDTAAVLKR